MHKEGEVIYELEGQYEKTVRGTGRKYKVWSFITWSPIMEDLEKCKHETKGKWLIVETPSGKYRYNLESRHEVTYK